MRRARPRTVLVTGGSSGVGLETVRLLAARGDRPCILDRQETPAAKRILASCRGRILLGDVSRFDTAMQAVDALGEVDGLVNCAGISRARVCWEMTESEWDEVIAVDLKGAFNTTRAVAPGMRRRRRGRIVNVSSVNATRGKWGLANYSAAKAGMIGLTKTCARELGKYGVTVNAVAPGMILTPLTRDLPPEIMARASKEAALGRIARPEDVASVIVFLLSDGARHVTGAVIPVDGGQTA